MTESDIFKSSLKFGQLAIDGNWENALMFEPEEFCLLEKAKQYIGDREEVAFEVFFDEGFWGIRNNDTSENLIKQIVNYACAMRNSKNGFDFFKIISNNNAINLTQYFIRSEIGAINAWRSIQPYIIDNPIDSLLNFEKMWEKLSLAQVSKNTTHRKAIEFTFNSDNISTHWFGYMISDVTAPYKIKKEKLKNALNIFLDCYGPHGDSKQNFRNKT